MRIECAGGLVFEQRGDDVASHAVHVLSGLADTRGCKHLEFAHRNLHSRPMRLDDARITADKGGD